MKRINIYQSVSAVVAAILSVLIASLNWIFLEVLWAVFLFFTGRRWFAEKKMGDFMVYPPDGMHIPVKILDWLHMWYLIPLLLIGSISAFLLGYSMVANWLLGFFLCYAIGYTWFKVA